MTKLHAPLKQLFSQSKVLTLDFKKIDTNEQPENNIRLFFEAAEKNGTDPKTPANRQRFNDRMLAKNKKRYLVSAYGEDRVSMLKGSQIAKESRTLHLGIDIFSKDLETVYAPCAGSVVRVGREPQDHSFGYYLIFKPDDDKLPYIFFGHLNSKVKIERQVKAGQPIAKLGDYKDGENGGWSRHLHLQMLKKMPPAGEALVGYSSKLAMPINAIKYPDPMKYFPNWKLN